MNNLKVMFSKETDHWETPKHIYVKYMSGGYVDPCPLHSEVDNLKTNWRGKVFINPPYSDIKSWVEKAIEELDNVEEIVFLVPARTDTRWFHRLLEKSPDIEFIKGRLRFSEKGSAPFPSMLITLRNQIMSTPIPNLDNFFCFLLYCLHVQTTALTQIKEKHKEISLLLKNPLSKAERIKVRGAVKVGLKEQASTSKKIKELETALHIASAFQAEFKHTPLSPEQMEEGLKQMNEYFSPREESKTDGEGQ